MNKWVRNGLILLATLSLLVVGQDKLFPPPVGKIPDGVISHRKATKDEKDRNRKLAKDYNINLRELAEPDAINLIPVFEYISHNNIELYDFSKISVTDVDVSKTADLERFILTHVYYITQAKA